MSWTDLINRLDTTVTRILGGVPATFTPQDGSGDQVISVLPAKPAIEEEYSFNGVAGQAPNVVRLFVPQMQPVLNDTTGATAVLTPAIMRGDVIVLNGVGYVVEEVMAGLEGGITLKLRAQ